MKRIKAACLLQTICFQPKEGYPTEFNRQQVRKEYEAYKSLMDRRGTKYVILTENTQPDGSIIVELKKQNNQQAVGNYLD